MRATLVLTLSLALALPALATEQFEPKPEATVTGAAAAPWDRTERLHDRHPELITEKFNRDTQPKDMIGEGIVDAFGTSTPSSGTVLLHFAPGWKKATQKVPVLLVHGTGSNANHSFAVARDGHGEMVNHLTKEGRAVFAVSFAAPFGSNWLQREMLADAIARVKQVTGSSQVDLIAHSKGCVVARMYISDVKKPWGTAYRGDVRRAVLLASPNLGIDFTWRHPNSATFVFPAMGVNFASPRDMTYMIDLTGSHGVYGGTQDGVLELAYDLARQYPYSLLEVDGIVSRLGGFGTLGHYPGIEAAIERTGHLIDQLEHAGVDPRVELALMAGTNQYFANPSPLPVPPIPGELDGPSDGMVLSVSLEHTSGLTRRGAHLLELKRLKVNHGECVYAPEALAWISGILAR